MEAIFVRVLYEILYENPETFQRGRKFGRKPLETARM